MWGVWVYTLMFRAAESVEASAVGLRSGDYGGVGVRTVVAIIKAE